MFEPIDIADIEWTDGGLPRSRVYGDVYFSDFGGLEETHHVFLNGNDLAARMAVAEKFTVGETGFGSGLNFLALWRMWRQIAPKTARLHFFSAEKHPLDAADMARIHALFPEIASLGEELRQKLPLPVPGYHRLMLDGGRVTLTLMYGDALAMFREQNAAADAWFLDGFAPRLNADLWTLEMAQELRRLSAKGATLATFSTSSQVMGALAEAGFAVEKQAGFGRKKHMLRGAVTGEVWQPAMPYVVGEVAIIGAGLAGASVGYALALRGFSPIVYETAPHPAAGASSNPCAVFYPGVASSWQPATTFYYMGFSYSQSLLRELAAQYDIKHARCGMVLFPKPSDKAGYFAKVLAGMRPHHSLFHSVSPADMPTVTGVNLREEGVFFPAGGWVDVKDYVRAQLAHPAIEVRTGGDGADATIQKVYCDGGWKGTAAAGLSTHIHPVAGQLTHLGEFPPLGGLRCVLSYGGYAAPVEDGRYYLGATYERGEEAISAPNAAQAAADNAAKLARLLRHDLSLPKSPQGWAGVRSVSADRMPIIGKHGGDYVSLAHASRGLLSCGIAGEYIASLMAGEPSPLPRSLARMIGSGRFSI